MKSAKVDQANSSSIGSNPSEADDDYMVVDLFFDNLVYTEIAEMHTQTLVYLISSNRTPRVLLLFRRVRRPVTICGGRGSIRENLRY